VQASGSSSRAKKQPVSTAGLAPASRVPPHSLEAEQALLAACIHEGGQESISLCIENKIKPDAFYKPAHQVIYQGLLDLYEKGTPVDEIILAEHLRAQKKLDLVGGHLYLAEITDKIKTSAHLPYYLKRVRDAYLLRSVISTSSQAIENAYSGQDDVDQFLDTVEQSIFRLSEDRINDTAKPIKESVHEAVMLMERIKNSRGEITGAPSGFTDLDRLTLGFHRKDMVVVAARPSMGKTSLALNITEAAVLPRGAKGKIHPTLFFSLEMGADQLAMRLLCSRARISLNKLKDGFLSQEQTQDLKRTADELKQAPLWIDDSSGLTILEVRAKARRVHAQHGLGLIVVDYLQLISGTDPRVPREQQIAEISRGIKAMAKELNVPVIVLGQLNRESEKERRQPRVSDLRESGSIEQDADMVILLAKKKDADDEEEMSAPTVLRDLILAKHRNGPVGSITIAFTKSLTRFENYTATQQPA